MVAEVGAARLKETVFAKEYLSKLAERLNKKEAHKNV
jgi:2-hydroxy-3-keto-5-methylthiopentenyl-1-phosphate phosphatase